MSKDVLEKLDNMIRDLSEIQGINTWDIHLRSDIAKELFGSPIPEAYNGNPIVVNDSLKQTKLTNGEWSSDILVLEE